MESVLVRPAAEAVLRNFLSDNFPSVNGQEVDPEDSLVETGVIDSTDVLELVDFVEIVFCVAVPDEELVPENFDSIARIADYLARKLADVA
jgi:acyl carrier protein